MEQRSSDLCVIFAGYKDRMDQFFSYIPGMQSRVNLHIVRKGGGRAFISVYYMYSGTDSNVSVHTSIPPPPFLEKLNLLPPPKNAPWTAQDFPDMDEEDLLQVGKLMFNNMEYKLSPDAEPSLRE